jgi:hypothetical protein
MLRSLRKAMNARGAPPVLQLAVLLSLLCLVLFSGMWGASRIGIPGVPKVFNVLLLLVVFICLFFLVATAIVLLAQLGKKLLDLYVSR